jgi:hypothetical protein
MKRLLFEVGRVILTLMLATSAHAMNPDSPKKPRSCAEKFIDAFMTCNPSWRGSEFFCKAGALRYSNYVQCVRESSAEEQSEGSIEYRKGVGSHATLYYMPRFTLIGKNQTLEGGLYCCRNEGSGKTWCDMQSSQGRSDVHDSLFPALKALCEVQTKLRQEQQAKEEREKEKNMIRHQPPH